MEIKTFKIYKRAEGSAQLEYVGMSPVEEQVNGVVAQLEAEGYKVTVIPMWS